MNFKNNKQILTFPSNTSTKKTWKERFKAFSFPLQSSMGVYDYWGLLFIGCVSLFVPKLGYVIPIYILLKTSRRQIAAVVEIRQAPKELEQMVQFIQTNHLQSLTEAIESNPMLLHYEYKKRSLLSWCKFYNNTKALMVVVQMNKKYPKEKIQNFAA